MSSSIERLTYEDVAKTIDHSLLRPELDDRFIEDGCRLAAKYEVASVCCKPADVQRAVELLKGTSVAVGTVIGFPHGGTTTEVKVFEAQQALSLGATELDMVINIGALRSGRDAYVRDEIAAIVAVAHPAGAIVKVILENAYLDDEQKVRGCKLVEAAGAAVPHRPEHLVRGSDTHVSDAQHRLLTEHTHIPPALERAAAAQQVHALRR